MTLTVHTSPVAFPPPPARTCCVPCGASPSPARAPSTSVTRLRGKLGTAVVRTVRGVGYRLADEAAITLAGTD